MKNSYQSQNSTLINSVRVGFEVVIGFNSKLFYFVISVADHIKKFFFVLQFLLFSLGVLLHIEKNH